MRKRSLSGTKVVSFSCDADLAERFKCTVEEGDRSEYLTNILRVNMDSGCNTMMCSTSNVLPTTAPYSSRWKTTPDDQFKSWDFTDDELRKIKRRMNELKD